MLTRWAASLTLPSAQTTWFNFLASHDGIGLNPLRGLLPEEEILALVDELQAEGALVNWKNNPDGTRSPYEVNVTYMDALSPREASDSVRLARFLLAHAILLSFPGVPAVYIQSMLGSRNDYHGVETLGYNRAINRQKFDVDNISAALNNPQDLRHQVYQRLSRLITLRRNNRAFHPDSRFEIKSITPQVMQIKRTAECGEEIIALFNISNINQLVHIDINNGFDLINETDIKGGALTLQPWQVMWIKN